MSRRLLPWPMLLWMALLVPACTGRGSPAAPPAVPPADAETPELPVISPQEEAGRDQARRIAAALDDRVLAAQILLTGLDGNGSLGWAMEALLRDISPGGIMLFKMNLALDKERIPGFLQTVSDLAAEGTGGIRPFMAVDHEGGLVHRFGDGVERLPPPLSFWDSVQSNGREAALQRIEEGAGRSGKELKSLGINLNLAPVAEILNDENQRFLEDRSYGRDGDFVAAAAVAFIRGMDAAGIACAVKHFPGNSSADPHSAQAVLTADRETLDRMVRPFGDIIREVNPAGVMVSHVIVDAWEPGVHASRSPAVISGWLRDGLGYRGIILGDDFSMGAISAAGLREEEAIVDALNAGVDMVMTWPRNLARVHRSILKALDEGRITRKRLEEASARILYEKIRYGLAD